MASPVRLSGSESVLHAAAACRRALRAFLALSPEPESMAAWLDGPYRAALSFGNPGPRAAFPRATATPGEIEDAKQLARRLVTVAVAPSDGNELGRALPARLNVRRAVDASGGVGFVLVAAKDSLRDRVAALVIADYLSRPAEFASAMTDLVDWTGRAPRVDARAIAPTQPELRARRTR